MGPCALIGGVPSPQPGQARHMSPDLSPVGRQSGQESLPSLPPPATPPPCIYMSSPPPSTPPLPSHPCISKGQSPGQYHYTSRDTDTADSLPPPPLLPKDLLPSPSSSSLFPLPLPSNPFPPPGRRRRRRESRRRAQRRLRRQRGQQTVRSMVSVLNRWYLGRGQGGRRRVRGVRKGGLLGEVLGHLELRASQFCRGLASSGSGDDDKGVESNMEDFYSQMKPDSTTCVPLTAENAALPPACAKRVHLFDILPPGVVAKLQEEGIRMIGPAVPSPVRPAMGVEPEEYPAIIQKAVASGVCELTETEPESIQGLFGVRKDEDRARVILDCRPANELCYPPPNPDLPHIGVLAQLGFPEEWELRGAILDLANYYHTIIMPEEWRTLFGLPAVVIDGKKMYPR